MRNFQGIIFVLIRTYREIFKSGVFRRCSSSIKQINRFKYGKECQIFTY